MLKQCIVGGIECLRRFLRTRLIILQLLQMTDDSFTDGDSYSSYR